MKDFFLVLVIATASTGLLSAKGKTEPLETEILKVPGYLVENEWLANNLDSENLVVLDTARDLADYEKNHIKGALYANREAYWTKIDGIPGMFPGVEAIIPWLEGLGISNDSAVVIYDAGPGLWAARVAWTLAYLGHDNWAVLDGGYSLWEADGLPLENGSSSMAQKGTFIPEIQDELLTTGDEILEHLEDPNFVVVDTRSPQEYDGSDVRAKRGGHIPNSVSIEWKLNNTEGDLPVFLPSDELAEFYSAEGVDKTKEIVTLCQTGVRGAHSWLALTLAGYKNVSLYDGSWAEWAENDAYPVEE